LDVFARLAGEKLELDLEGRLVTPDFFPTVCEKLTLVVIPQRAKNIKAAVNFVVRNIAGLLLFRSCRSRTGELT